MTGFGISLAEARRARHMTQAHLAGAADVSLSTVQRAERGVPVSAESVRALCATLGLDLPAPLEADPPVVDAPVTGDARPTTWRAVPFVAASCVMPVETWIHWKPPGGAVASDLGLSAMWWDASYYLGAYACAAMACAVAGALAASRRHAASPRMPARMVYRAVGALAGMAVVPAFLFAYVYGIQPPWFGFGPHGALEMQDIAPAWATTPGSPLALAGMAIGDRVVAIGGRPVSTAADVERARYRLAPGDHVAFSVERPEREPSGTVAATDTYPIPPTRAVELDVVAATDSAGSSALGTGHFGNLSGMLSSTTRPATFPEEVGLLARTGGQAIDLATHPVTLGHERVWDDLDDLVGYAELREWTGPVTSVPALGALALCAWMALRGRGRDARGRMGAMRRQIRTALARVAAGRRVTGREVHGGDVGPPVTSPMDLPFEPA